MKIKLTERFDLMIDDTGDKWLVEKSISKAGKSVQKTYCGYHWHFETLLKSFMKKRVDEKEAKTVKGALKALAETEKEMESLAKKIGDKLDEKNNL